MINEIHVRTNKAEYNPGEDICGAVYLRIISPTGGRGVKVSFCGYEQFEYEYKNTGREDQYVGYQESKDYINQHVVLHESPGPLSIGNTVFPFKIHLPVEIPGTFQASGETDKVKWKALVEYILEAEVIGTCQLTIRTVINIDQSLPREISANDCPKGVSAEYVITKLLLFTNRINTTARLQSHKHRTGENIKLRVIITNNSSITVQSLKIQLLRKLILMSRRRLLPESREDENVEGTDDRVFICPEDHCSVHSEQTIVMTNYQKGLDNIQIPLRYTDGTSIAPAVRGLFVQCEYKMKVIVTLSNLTTFDLMVPISVIQAQRNTEWSQWRPPEWLSHDDFDIQHSDSIFGVPEGLLRYIPNQDVHLFRQLP